MENLSVHVDANTGPFEEAHDWLYKPGANVNVADNGEGKTWLGRLLCLLASAKVPSSLFRVNDDATGASLVARMTFGRAEIRAQKDGTPKISNAGTLPPVEGLPDPISVLITGNHYTTPWAALKARVSALLRWIGIDSDEHSILRLLGDSPRMEDLSFSRKGDLGEVADAIRKACHKKRQEAELAEAQQRESLAGLEGQKVAILGSFQESEVSTLTPTTAEIQGALTWARDSLASLRQRRNSGLEEEARRSQVRGSLGERPDTATQEAELAVAIERLEELKRLHGDASIRAKLADTVVESQVGAESEAVAAAALALRNIAEWPARVKASVMEGSAPRWGQGLDAAKEEALRLVLALEGALRFNPGALQIALRDAEAVRAEVSRLHREIGDADTAKIEAYERLAAAKRAVATYNDTAAKLAAPLEIPAEVEIQIATDRVTSLEVDLAKHRTAEKYQRLSAQLELARKELEAREELVKFWASQNDQVWVRLADLTNEKLQSEVIRVCGEEVQIFVDDRWISIADSNEVSEGQVVAACYDLMLDRREEKIIVIEKSTPIGPSLLESIGRKARDKGIILIMESAYGAVPGKYSVDYYPAAQEVA